MREYLEITERVEIKMEIKLQLETKKLKGK